MVHEISLFCYDLSRTPKWIIFLISVTGVFVTFTLQSIIQEIILTKYSFKNSFFLTFIQCLTYSLLSVDVFFDLIAGKRKLQAPIYFYFYSGFEIAAAIAFSNYSLENITLTTQTVFRSSNIVLILLELFKKIKNFSFINILSVFAVIFGLIGITISDIKANNKYDLSGFVSILTSLLFEAFSSNLHEVAFIIYNAKPSETIAMIYLFGSLIIGLAGILFGSFSKGFYQMKENTKLSLCVFSFSLLGALGIRFYNLLLSSFGLTVSKSVKSIRMAVTVLISFLLFKDNKKFTFTHLVSILSVFLGVFLNLRRNSLNENGYTKHVHSNPRDFIESDFSGDDLAEEDSSEDDENSSTNKEEEINEPVLLANEA